MNDEIRCPENQVLSLVRPGRRRCDRVCNSNVPICTPGNSKECVCKRGFLRLTGDLIAPCVGRDECPKCEKNQEFQLCGSACPRYCGMPDNVACVLLCVQGCFCDQYYCSENQIFIRPGRSWCDQVCNTYIPICTSGNSEKCLCKRGFVRLTDNFRAPCAHPNDCVKCEENQEIQLCGAACPRYCGMPDNMACVFLCIQGCFCKSQYVLRSKDSNECILESECPRYS
ncbi:riddle [Holotrichia oblita]|uniref:Riddle n=1 Tax=Holotrichia oblita TaxID=644536 RepID=A0ACB9T9F2_HOLOL|nr:riddle [Holotrichia oblita]